MPPGLEPIHLRLGRGPHGILDRQSLIELLKTLRANSSRALHLASNERGFCSGLDRAEMKAGHEAELLSLLGEALRALAWHEAPVLAHAKGPVVGGGLLLFQCADLRVMDDDDQVFLAMPGVSLGVLYPDYVMQILKWRSTTQAEHLLLHERRFSSVEARQVGLAESATAEDFARICSLPRQAYAHAKRELRKGIFASA